MIRNAVWLRALGFGGLWLLVGACDGTNSNGTIGGVAGILHTPDAGEPVSFAGAGDSGGSAGDATGAASAMNVGSSAGSDGPSNQNGHGHGGKHSGMGKAGASGTDPSNAGTSNAGTSNAGANGGTTGGYTGNGGGAAGSGLMIPCNVYAAYSVCRNCHIDPPIDGAPMPLLTLQDLQSNAGSAYLAIQTGLMPKAGTLAPQDAALILAWLASGAQGVPRETCPE